MRERSPPGGRDAVRLGALFRLARLSKGMESSSRIEGTKLALDHHAQRRQVNLDRVPHMLRGDVFVVVPIDVARRGHVLPRDRRMPRLEFVWQTTRRFGNDLEAARYGINGARVGPERVVVKARCEVGGGVRYDARCRAGQRSRR
jgi:hypothetical protein